ncbi:MAG: amidohydrolase family protein [Alphaproteobacteria bacterium]
MAADCPPPDPDPRPPGFVMPDGAWDCHAHVFGPLDRFPYVADRSFTPPAASVDVYARMLSRLGFGRGVLVQPSVYGTDNRAQAAALEAGNGHWRGVAVVDDDVSAEALSALDAAGFRGARFNLVYRGGVARAALEAVARLIAPFGWHIQLFADVSRLDDLAALLAGLPVPTVIDHMGFVPAARGTNDPGFQSLLRTLGAGRAWVKLSGANRITSRRTAPYDDVVPFARALIAANPDRLVFGTDWPHVHLPVPMANTGALLGELAFWAPDLYVREKILVHNPARLYG